MIVPFVMKGGSELWQLCVFSRDCSVCKKTIIWALIRLFMQFITVVLEHSRVSARLCLFISDVLILPVEGLPFKSARNAKSVFNCAITKSVASIIKVSTHSWVTSPDLLKFRGSFLIRSETSLFSDELKLSGLQAFPVVHLQVIRRFQAKSKISVGWRRRGVNRLMLQSLEKSQKFAKLLHDRYVFSIQLT